MSLNDNDKDNRKKPPIWYVDKEAARYERKYSNPDGHKLYCKAINHIPYSKLLELEKQAEGGKTPGRLFSTLISQELERIGQAKKRTDLDDFRNSYGG